MLENNLTCLFHCHYKTKMLLENIWPKLTKVLFMVIKKNKHVITGLFKCWTRKQTWRGSQGGSYDPWQGLSKRHFHHPPWDYNHYRRANYQLFPPDTSTQRAGLSARDPFKVSTHACASMIHTSGESMKTCVRRRYQPWVFIIFSETHCSHQSTLVISTQEYRHVGFRQGSLWVSRVCVH